MSRLQELDVENYRDMIELVTAEYPTLEVVATTLRTVRSATVNDWGAMAWSRETACAVRGAAPDSRSSTGWAEATASHPDSSTAADRKATQRPWSTAPRTALSP